jgi:hypothetical protein
MQLHRPKRKLLLWITGLAVLIVGGGTTAWIVVHHMPAIPVSSQPTQHLYPSDDGHAAILSPGQHVEFDFGDMSKWSLTFQDLGTGVEVTNKGSSDFARLSSTTYVPIAANRTLVTATRNECSASKESCSSSIQLVVNRPDQGFTDGPPNGYNVVTHH